MVFSLARVSFSAKLATLNHDVFLSSFGPYELATMYLMTSPPVDVLVISGSVPRRPITVRRATWEGRVVEKLRANDDVVMGARAKLRSGDRRKDILNSGTI